MGGNIRRTREAIAAVIGGSLGLVPIVPAVIAALLVGAAQGERVEGVGRLLAGALHVGLHAGRHSARRNYTGGRVPQNSVLSEDVVVAVRAFHGIDEVIEARGLRRINLGERYGA